MRAADARNFIGSEEHKNSLVESGCYRKTTKSEMNALLVETKQFDKLWQVYNDEGRKEQLHKSLEIFKKNILIVHFFI